VQGFSVVGEAKSMIGLEKADEELFGVVRTTRVSIRD
jgi:hypothetical protein